MMGKYFTQIEIIERLRDEVIRLATAAGAEGNNTPALRWLDDLDEGIRHLIVAATAGADAHPYYRNNLDKARQLLGFE